MSPYYELQTANNPALNEDAVQIFRVSAIAPIGTIETTASMVLI